MSLARQAIDEHGAVQKEPELQAFIDCVLMTDLRTVVEIGSQDCGMLWVFSQIATSTARIVSVDLAIPEQYPHRRAGQSLEYIIGDSHTDETYERVRKALDGRDIDLLFIDGDHSYDGVRQDFERYSPLVASSGVIAMHDIVPHGNPLSEVDRYWREVKAWWPGTVREFVCGQAGDTWRGLVPVASCGIGVLLP